MDILTKYSFNDWIYGILVSIIGAILFAAIVFMLRWFWRRLRSFSAKYRREDQTNRIIKIFVHRRHTQKKDIRSLSRAHFFVIVRCLQMLIGGISVIALGAIVSWIVDFQMSLYVFLLLGVWLFIEAGSWLDMRWSSKLIDDIDEQALSEAAAILGETVDEVRQQVTRKNA